MSATLASGTFSPPGAVSRSCPRRSGSPRTSSGKRTTTSNRRGPSRISVAVAPPIAVSTSSRTSETLRPYRAIRARSTSIWTWAAPESTSTCRSAAPRTLSSTARISSPTRSRVAGSGPKTLTATSAFTPETTSSRRMAMGWVKLKATPGISASAVAMWSMSSSFDQPLFHSSMGWRFT